MIVLNYKQSAVQTFFVNPQQAYKYLSHTPQDLLFEFKSQESGKTYLKVLTPTVENERYSKFQLRTDQNTATDILFESGGFYDYTIYGNSVRYNTDPDASSILGIVERGLMEIVVKGQTGTMPDLSIPDNVVYYE